MAYAIWSLVAASVLTSACGYSEAEMQLERDKAAQLEIALTKLAERCNAGGEHVSDSP